MSSPRLTITLRSTSTIDPWWLRLEQIGIEDDTATLADAAELIDTLYSTDPCTEDTTTSEDPGAATTEEVVETTVRRVVCQYDDQANIDVQMHIIRSHPSAPYKLALQGGKLKTVETITETIPQTIVIEDAATITLEYPVLGNFSASWASAVYGASGRITPPIRRTGNTLSFGGATIKAGTITASYTTEYDLATITILGVDGEPGQCTARGFFHGLVKELELETPEPADELGTCRILWTVPSTPHQIECYRTVYVSQRCQCSPDELDGYSYEEVVDCPDYVKRCPGVLSECSHYLGTVVAYEYVECPDDMVEAVSVPAYYERVCCEAPSVTLPQCKEQKSSWQGGLGINGGVEQARALYGDDVEIIPIGPPGGICGTWTKRQQVISQRCCDGVLPLVWDTSINPEVMSPNSAATIAVSGGRYPITWDVVGTGFQFANGAKSTETSTQQVSLSALVVACGTAVITVRDGCSTISAAIKSTTGAWSEHCRVLLVQQSAGNYTSRHRLTRVIGCALATLDEDFFNTYPPSGSALSVLSVPYRWTGSAWVQDGGDVISNIAIMDSASFLAALAIVQQRISVVSSLPETPNESTRCTLLGSCSWGCA